MISKENQRVALTRRLLQEGLLRLLESQPIDHISVTELCRESGINRSTFYNHYTAPHDVLVDIQNSMTQDLKAISAKYSPDASNLDCLEEICIYMKEHKQIFTVLVTFNTDTDLVEVFRQIEQHYTASRVANAKRTDPDKLHLISAFTCTGCYFLIREWLIRDIQKTPREVAEMVFSFFGLAEDIVL